MGPKAVQAAGEAWDVGNLGSVHVEYPYKWDGVWMPGEGRGNRKRVEIEAWEYAQLVRAKTLLEVLEDAYKQDEILLFGSVAKTIFKKEGVQA